MKILILKFIAFTLILSSCQKQDSEGESTQFSGILKKLTYDNGDTRSFEYFSDNRLKRDFGETEFYEYNYEYNYEVDTIYMSFTSTRPNDVHYFKKYYKVDADSSIVLTTYPAGTSRHAYYFSDGLCGQDSIGDGWVYHKFEYLNDNCSYKETMFSDNNTPIFKVEYIITRDNKHSWETSITTAFYRKGDFGNEVDYKYFQNDEVTPINHRTSEYEYNSFDYPTKMTTNINGISETTYFEYY